MIMNHHFIKAYVDEYLSGTIDPRDRALFEEYLASHPELRAWIDEEKKLKGYLGNLKAPQPDENYWNSLENRILQKTVENEILFENTEILPKTGKWSAIRRYLIPLAAVFTALLWSFSSAPDRLVKQRTDTPSTAIGEYSQLADITLEGELMGSAILGPPGAVSRMILLKSLDGKY